MEAPHEECKVLGLAWHSELFWASSSVLRMSVILEMVPSPPPTQEFRKAPLAHSATWLLPLCCCPHVEVPDFLLHGGLLRVQLCSG